MNLFTKKINLSEKLLDNFDNIDVKKLKHFKIQLEKIFNSKIDYKIKYNFPKN
jgi:hypothetical protein